MSLRERKKQQNRNRILQAAREKFFKQGYKETTMSEIAAQAEVGVGTLYNYFSSKAELLLFLFSQEFEMLPRDGSIRKEDTVVSWVFRYIQPIIQVMEEYPKSFLQEIMQAVAENRFLRNNLIEMDRSFIKEFEICLEELKKEVRPKRSFSSSEAAQALYSVLMLQFFQYIYDDALTSDQLKANLQRQIAFLFRED